MAEAPERTRADKEDSTMQILPSTVQTDSRKLVEDLYDFLATIVRGWRLITVYVGITLALAVIYLARVKPVYLASARLLVLQHGEQPLTGANAPPVTTTCSSPWTGLRTRSRPTS